MDDGLSLRVHADDGAVTVVVEGGLARSSRLSRVLSKHLLDRGRVLVDISAMRIDRPASVAVFPTVLAAAGGWPAARMVLFGAAPEVARVLRSTGSTSGVSLARDREQARELLDVRPRRVRRTAQMPASPTAAPFARSLVRAACEDWSVPGLLERAELVANELVSNAVLHCAGESVLILSEDPRGLTVAVQDRSLEMPVLLVPGRTDDEGFGLRIVAEFSDGWGAFSHRRGKTVWALLCDRSDDG